mgnify:FL=1
MTKPVLITDANRNFDIHIGETATSGYSYYSDISYFPLKNVLNAYRRSTLFTFTEEKYRNYSKGFYPIMTLDVVVWQDDQEV